MRHWADGGATRLDNLVLLCRRHHRAVHEEGFRVELRDDHGDNGGHAVRFFWPDRRPVPEAPPMPAWNGAPLAPTSLELAAAGFTIDGDTATPDWHGEPLDLHWATTVLHPGTNPLPRNVPAGTRAVPNGDGTGAAPLTTGC